MSRLTTLLATTLAAAFLAIGSPMPSAGAATPTQSFSRSTAAPAPQVAARVSCTHTSSGSCIRGGQFCPQSKYKKSGYDAVGRRYVCKGDRTHPHWMKP